MGPTLQADQDGLLGGALVPALVVLGKVVQAHIGISAAMFSIQVIL